VTAAFTLQTVEPWMTSLAACGYMLVAQSDGKVEVVEFTGRVPSSFDEEFYRPDPSIKTFIGHPASIDNRNVRGFTAAVVPGCVRGFAEALKRYGTIGFDRALQPAIDRARKGMYVDWHTTLAIAIAEGELAMDPGARSIFLPSGHAPEPGATLPLEQLAKTLEQLANEGPDSLYGGAIGEKLVADLNAGGSSITLEDLANYAPLLYPSRTMPLQGKPAPASGSSTRSITSTGSAEKARSTLVSLPPWPRPSGKVSAPTANASIRPRRPTRPARRRSTRWIPKAVWWRSPSRCSTVLAPAPCRARPESS
jgi:gamma-glutamyltranspeptidase/glutathione hydrolase